MNGVQRISADLCEGTEGTRADRLFRKARTIELHAYTPRLLFAPPTHVPWYTAHIVRGGQRDNRQTPRRPLAPKSELSLNPDRTDLPVFRHQFRDEGVNHVLQPPLRIALVDRLA